MALAWSLVGLVYVCGALVAMFAGVLELRDIAREQPPRPVLPIALLWLAGAVTWPALLVVCAALVFFGDGW